ncbi:MAG TPA: NUDIX hydrolase [Gaiellaceae bacterium]|nr:NUDIX hydrolase [Gaiellaceae bacterium]
MSDLVRAAGGLVLRRAGGGLEVLLVHRPAYDDWSLPKGKLDADESEVECALREVEEETGLRCVLGREAGTTEYVDSRGRPKQVRYWTMVAPGVEPTAANEVDEVRWASTGEAAVLLDYAHDRELLRGLEQVAGSPCERVFLVRHAKAGNREKWGGPDELRPLTKPGWRQSAELANWLAGEQPAALLTSPYVRCVQTLEPLGELVGLPVQEHDALEEGGSAEPALELIGTVAALGPAVLSTHGDVMELSVHSLAARGVPLDGSLDFEKGATWVLDVEEGEVVAGRHVPPPS